MSFTSICSFVWITLYNEAKAVFLINVNHPITLLKTFSAVPNESSTPKPPVASIQAKPSKCAEGSSLIASYWVFFSHQLFNSLEYAVSMFLLLTSVNQPMWW